MSISKFEEGVQLFKAGDDPRKVATDLLDQMNEDERLGLMQGNDEFWDGLTKLFGGGYDDRPQPFGPVPRIGYPGVLFCDGPRGCVIGKGTAIPVPMARGATWDANLERKVGYAVGLEARSMGANHVGSVCINVPRHPAWGRVQESYSEDPYHLGEFAAAHIEGLQRNAIACVKHFALNSMEIARFQVDITVDGGTLHEVYLPHFRRAVEAGEYSIMSAYNSVNGHWAGQNRQLLTSVLRDIWKFRGFVITDWAFGVRNADFGIKSGLDIEDPFKNDLARNLAKALADGTISWDEVDGAGLNIFSSTLYFYATGDKYRAGRETNSNQNHRAFAREMMDRLCDNDDVQAAVEAAAEADVALVVVGYAAGDEGEHLVPSFQANPELQDLLPPLEGLDTPLKCIAKIVKGKPEGAGFHGRKFGGDRMSLRLRDRDVQIIKAVVKTNPRTIVSIVTAGAVIVEEWQHEVPAIIVGWYNGVEGGRALADVIMGRKNPSGHLPWSIPQREDHLPYFDMNAKSMTYDRWHGQKLLDKLGVAAAYPLGFGLSYTTFSLSDLSVKDTASDIETLHVSVKATNTGTIAGRCIIQIYGKAIGTDEEIMSRSLLGFMPVDLEAGESITSVVTSSVRQLQKWQSGRFVLTASEALIEAGQYCGDPSFVMVERAFPLCKASRPCNSP